MSFAGPELIVALAVVGLAAGQSAIVMREPTRPSQIVTQHHVECGGRRISIRWTARYPGHHDIEEIALDGDALADDQLRPLMSVVVDGEIEGISVLRCGDRDGAYEADLILTLGEAWAARTNSPRYVSLRLREGHLTIIRPR